MRPSTNVLLAGYVSSLLLAPLVLWALGQRPDAVDNRSLADFPETSAAALFDEDFYRQASDYFEDRLPLRDRAITTDAWIDYRIAGDSPVDEVKLGDDGWLFLTEAFEEACSEDVDPALVATTLEQMVDIIGASGRNSVIYTAPNKASVYPEHAASIPELECADAAREATLTAINNHAIPGFIDSWDHLRGLKTESELPIYNPLDTHWNPAFNDDVAKAVLDAIDPGLWDPSAVSEPGSEQASGELAALMGLPQTHEVPVQDVTRPDTVSTQLDDNDRFGPNTYATTATVRLIDESMFMMHDSFGNGLEPILVQYFEQSTYLHWRNIVNAPAHGGTVFARHVAAADIIVIESVERLLYRRFGNQLLDYPAALAAILYSDLPHREVTIDRAIGPSLDDVPADLADGRTLYLVLEFASDEGQRIRTTVDGERDDRWIPLEGPLRVGWDVTGAAEIAFDEELPPVISAHLVWLRS